MSDWFELLLLGCVTLLVARGRRVGHPDALSKRKLPYHGHRFPSQVISYAIWRCTRFCLSFREAEDNLAERGVKVSYEAIRGWWLKSGPRCQRALKRWERRLGDTGHVDAVFIKIRGLQHCLWRAVDQAAATGPGPAP